MSCSCTWMHAQHEDALARGYMRRPTSSLPRDPADCTRVRCGRCTGCAGGSCDHDMRVPPGAQGGRTPVWAAAGSGYLDVVKHLGVCAPATLSQPDNVGGRAPCARTRVRMGVPRTHGCDLVHAHAFMHVGHGRRAREAHSPARGTGRLTALVPFQFPLSASPTFAQNMRPPPPSPIATSRSLRGALLVLPVQNTCIFTPRCRHVHELTSLLPLSIPIPQPVSTHAPHHHHSCSFPSRAQLFSTPFL